MAKGKKKAGWFRYVKEAFTYRWNLLLFGGAAAAALLSPSPDIVQIGRASCRERG